MIAVLVLAVLVALFLLIPAKYDPIIGWKEEQSGWPPSDNIWRRRPPK